MKKLNIQSFNALIFGGGYGLSLADVSINRIDTLNFVRDENATLTGSTPSEPKCGSTTNITATVKLVYNAGYNVYLKLLLLGQDYDRHITDNADVINLILNDEFEISKDGAAGAHAIEWLNTEAKEAIMGISPYMAEGGNHIYLQDPNNIKNFMMDYQEGLSLDGGRLPALFDDSLRETLDVWIRQKAVEMLKNPAAQTS